MASPAEVAFPQLEAFLEELDPAYKQYAQPLHTGSYTNVAEIAAATRELLHEAGVPKGPAGVILAAAQKKAGAAGLQGAVVPEMGRWAQQLLTIQEEDGCLRLPADTPEDLPPALRFNLFIRVSYRKLHQLLWDGGNKGMRGHRPGYVVTGTPGIGKSAFALYFIQQLGRERQIIFYEYMEKGNRQCLKFDFSQRNGAPVTVRRMTASETLADGDLKEDSA